MRPHELRVEFRSDGKDYVALYKTFKLEDEADKYRIRLGAVTSSIDSGSNGLSYSNNAAFTTFDRDNDNYRNNCAILYKSGWWFKACDHSKLNMPYEQGKGRTKRDKTRLHDLETSSLSRDQKVQSAEVAVKVMATVFWDAKGVILSDILPQGQCINAAQYCSTLDRLRDAVRRKRPGLFRRDVVLKHDNAIPRSAIASALRLGISSSSYPQSRPHTL
ncbi:angiopoietin-related protein 2 [Elysia marginata]|uniref:Angiopoietin-related protein 2 n=1 Tax=Elysia marginata TaxID=1093978 RepID=A0AAV4ES81_9GAST|nr:angiopoietin-related protein 2 [Elysia marginata]